MCYLVWSGVSPPHPFSVRPLASSKLLAAVQAMLALKWSLALAHAARGYAAELAAMEEEDGEGVGAAAAAAGRLRGEGARYAAIPERR